MLPVFFVASTLILTSWVLRRSAALGISAFLLELMLAWSIPNGLNIGTIGSFNVYFSDILTISGLYIFFLNLQSIRSKYSDLVNILFVLELLVAFSIVRGCFTFGVEQAVNESRGILVFFGVASWALFCKTNLPLSSMKLRQVFLTCSVLLLCIEVSNIGTFGLGSASSSINNADGIFETGRPLVAIQALFLVLAIPVLLSHPGVTFQQVRISKLVASLCLIGSVIAQHRSVWLATAALLACLLFTSKARAFALAHVLSGFLVFVIIALGLGLPPSLTESFTESASNQGTLLSRTGSWSVYLEQFTSFSSVDQLFGLPFGSGWGRFDPGNGLWAEFNPHNWYLIVLLRIGVVGLAAFFLYYFFEVRKIYAGFKRSGLGLSQFASILVFQFFYAAPWQVLSALIDANDLSDVRQSNLEKRNLKTFQNSELQAQNSREEG